MKKHNYGPDAMRIAQAIWKKDRAVVAAGGRPLFATWADTLRAGWAQARRLSVRGCWRVAALLPAVARSSGRRCRAALVAARSLLNLEGSNLTAPIKILVSGYLHQAAHGFNPSRHH